MDLVLIVDPEYGEGLRQHALKGPVWIVDTPGNHPIWKQLIEQQDPGEVGGLTIYSTANHHDRLGNLTDTIATLEQHHGKLMGDHFLFPLGFALHVVGLPLSAEIKATLMDYGFALF